MKRLTAVVLSVALALASTGCRSDDSPRLALTGSVVDATTVIPVPAVPDTTPGLPSPLADNDATDTVPAAATGSAARAGFGPRWARIASVSVRPGDVVEPGQELARLDETALRAGVDAASAELALARASVTLINERIGDVSEGRSELGTKSVDLDKTIADLETKRADVANKLAAAKAAYANPPSNPTTPTPGTPTLPQQIAALEAALAKLETGLEQARTGRSQITSATAELDTVKATLTGLRSAGDAVVEAREASLRIAQQQLENAVVLAPEAAVVVSAALGGEVLASGAPLVTLRPSSATRVETYVTADQARRMARGTQAVVYVDALPGRGQPAHVALVGSEFEFVPTTFATQIVHLSRGVRVVVELDGTRWIAPGTPADVEISVK